jgi:hypothetical protein
MSEYKIEDDIPIPSRTGPLPACPYPLKDMKIGQSFAIPASAGLTIKGLRSSIHRYAKHANISLTVREMPSGGFRVWRAHPIVRMRKLPAAAE